MEIWLSQNKEKFRLPVLPESFQITSSNMNERVDINDIGKINLLGKSDLKEINLSRFFPNQEYSFVEYKGFPKPWKCVEKIEKWKKSGQPIRLIITETIINIEMGIENFVYGEQDGTGDVYYSLDLAEYIRLKVNNKSNNKYTPPNTKRPAESKPTQKTYTVKKGDDLWSIAKRLTGNAMNYKKISKENNIKNPNKIKIGQKLVI